MSGLSTTSQPTDRLGDQPRFTWQTRVHFDELDALGMLHNARYPLLLERASSAFFEANGWQWERDPALNPDAHHVVREQAVRYLAPVFGTSDLAVEMWTERLGDTSAALAFEVRSVDGTVVHARAQRVIVKLDPATYLPSAWTPRLRACLGSLLRSAER